MAHIGFLMTMKEIKARQLDISELLLIVLPKSCIKARKELLQEYRELHEEVKKRKFLTSKQEEVSNA